MISEKFLKRMGFKEDGSMHGWEYRVVDKDDIEVILIYHDDTKTIKLFIDDSEDMTELRLPHEPTTQNIKQVIELATKLFK